MVKLGDSPINAGSTTASEVDELLEEKPKPKARRKLKPIQDNDVPVGGTHQLPLRVMVGQVAEQVLAQNYSMRDLKQFCNLLPKAIRMGWKHQNRRAR